MSSAHHSSDFLGSLSSRWTISSLCIHAALLIIVLLWNVSSSHAQPKKLLVRTVKVREFSPSPLIATEIPQKTVPVVEKPEPKTKEISPEAAEKIIEVEAPPQNVIEEAQIVEIEEPKPIKEAAPKNQAPEKKTVKNEPIKKEISKKEISTQTQKKPQNKPTSQKPASKQSEKKPSNPKQQDKAKQDKSKQDKVKQDTAKQAAQQAKKAEEAARQKNLEAALQSLNKVSNNSKSLVAVSSEPVSKVSSVGTLASETIQTVSCEGAEECSPAESRYIAELIRRLKLSLKLPEYGEVRLKLIIARSGAVTSLTILNSSSSLNKKSVEQKLKNLSFPAFGNSFQGEKSHTFTLILSNEA